MLVWATDESGDTLVGALDGSNHTFRTLQPMRLDKIVDVFVNGQRRVAELDNGYTLQDTRTVIMREAPVPEDTVAVAYCADRVLPAVAGGTPVGLTTALVVPEAPTTRLLVPGAPLAREVGRPGALRVVLDR